MYNHCDGNNSELPLQPIDNDNSDQLSLSFRGQVYVFESVTPDKVQAVLLLLGGSELPQAGTRYVDAVPQQTQRLNLVESLRSNLAVLLPNVDSLSRASNEEDAHVLIFDRVASHPNALRRTQPSLFNLRLRLRSDCITIQRRRRHTLTP
ncbi:unnamed protein product [Vicia faba]|uniref:Tify domain-containing protein n=1 Tax=Vicia faba TaxID=3906 RepID=A0AAV1ANF8_VICFA|nr:unnamed protein product [Vicia faba]